MKRHLAETLYEKEHYKDFSQVSLKSLQPISCQRLIGVRDPSHSTYSAGRPSKYGFVQNFGQTAYNKWDSIFIPPKEEWRFVPGTNKKYQVSTLGRVRFHRSDRLVQKQLTVWHDNEWISVPVYDYQWELRRQTVDKKRLWSTIKWSNINGLQYGVGYKCPPGCCVGGKTRKRPSGAITELCSFLVLHSFVGNAEFERHLSNDEQREAALEVADDPEQVNLLLNSKPYAPFHLEGEPWDCRPEKLIWIPADEERNYNEAIYSSNDNYNAGVDSAFTAPSVEEELLEEADRLLRNRQGLAHWQITRMWDCFEIRKRNPKAYPLKLIAISCRCSTATVSRYLREWRDQTQSSMEEEKAKRELQQERERTKHFVYIPMFTRRKRTDENSEVRLQPTKESMELHGPETIMIAYREELRDKIYEWTTSVRFGTEANLRKSWVDEKHTAAQVRARIFAEGAVIEEKMISKLKMEKINGMKVAGALETKLGKPILREPEELNVDWEME